MLNCLVWNNIVVKMLQKVQGAVSYTHLDVYKRQGCNGAKMRGFLFYINIKITKLKYPKLFSSVWLATC